MTLRFSPEQSKFRTTRICEELLAKRNVLVPHASACDQDQIPVQALTVLGNHLLLKGVLPIQRVDSQETDPLLLLSSDIVLCLLGGRVTLSSSLVACCLTTRNEFLEAVFSEGHQNDQDFLVWMFGTAVVELNLWRFISIALLRQIHIRNQMFKGENCTILEMISSLLPYHAFRWTSKPGTDGFREEFRQWMLNVGLPKYQMFWALTSEFVFNESLSMFPTIFAVEPKGFRKAEISEINSSVAQRFRSLGSDFPCLFIATQVGPLKRSIVALGSESIQISLEKMTYSVPVSTLPHFVALIKLSVSIKSIYKVKFEVEGFHHTQSLSKCDSTLICLPLRVNPQDLVRKDVLITFSIEFEPGISDHEDGMSTAVEYIQIWKVPSLN